MTYPAPALVHIIYSTALMVSFLLTGWLYIRRKAWRTTIPTSEDASS